MNKNERIEQLERKIAHLEIALLSATKGMLTINDAKKRDYIVRTKYYGKITDAKIKKDFKEEVEARTKDSFDGVCNNILNYRFVMQGEVYTGNILDVFYKTLEQYEYKQIVLNEYGKQ